MAAGARNDGLATAVEDIEPGFVLVVSRLMPYKNVDAVVETLRRLPHRRLGIVGDGPARARLPAELPSNVVLVPSMEDDELKWLSKAAAGVAAAWEDFGLTPPSGGFMRQPCAELRWRRYPDSMTHQTTVFFEVAYPADIAHPVERLSAMAWDQQVIEQHARTSRRRRSLSGCGRSFSARISGPGRCRRVRSVGQKS